MAFMLNAYTQKYKNIAAGNFYYRWEYYPEWVIEFFGCARLLTRLLRQFCEKTFLAVSCSMKNHNIHALSFIKQYAYLNSN